MTQANALRDIILKSGFVSSQDFDAAVKSSKELGKPVDEILVYRGLITEEVLGQLIAEYYRVPYTQLVGKSVSSDALKMISEQAANTFRIVPFSKQGNILHVAMEDPADLEAREFIKRKSGLQLKIFFASSANISKALRQYKKDIKVVFTKIIEENIAKSKAGEIKDAQELASDVPVIKILDTIMEYASAENASDIHFEVMETVFMIRFRIDGVLRDILSLPKKIHPAVTARIKILAELKIDEHRTPQDGRFKFKLKDNTIALRVSILPGFYGENIVLRILQESARPRSMEELGLTGHNLDLIKQNIARPHGMILVTGPTGSGKTTTLYSILTILNTAEVKICTVEDPIEYGIKRINQIQVNVAAGLTFAVGLRSLLRHDPDIIMVGEIRDKETAEIAIHASLTGHLVLSTLHTNDASGSIPRLLDMGAEGFLVASTVNLVIAQRLVRKICSSCIEKYQPDAEVMKYLQKQAAVKDASTSFYRGKGCKDCGQKGYKGRIGIFEVLAINEEIRNLIIKRVSAEEIFQAALRNNMIPLIQDGINKANGGITTIEEVLRAVRQ